MQAQGAPRVHATTAQELSAIWRHSQAGVAVMGGALPSEEVTPKPTAASDAAANNAERAADAPSRAEGINESRLCPGSWDAQGVVLTPGSGAEVAYSRTRGGVSLWTALRLLIWRQSRALRRNKALLGELLCRVCVKLYNFLK